MAYRSPLYVKIAFWSGPSFSLCGLNVRSSHDVTAPTLRWHVANACVAVECLGFAILFFSGRAGNACVAELRPSLCWGPAKLAEVMGVLVIRGDFSNTDLLKSSLSKQPLRFALYDDIWRLSWEAGYWRKMVSVNEFIAPRTRKWRHARHGQSSHRTTHRRTIWPDLHTSTPSPIGNSCGFSLSDGGYLSVLWGFEEAMFRKVFESGVSQCFEKRRFATGNRARDQPFRQIWYIAFCRNSEMSLFDA